MEHDEAINRLVSSIDPVDADQLATQWSGSAASAALFEEITTMSTQTVPTATAQSSPAPRRPAPANGRRYRRLPRAAFAVAAAIVAFVIGLGLLPGPDAAYAIVEQADGRITVNVLAQFRDADALAADLRRHGIDAKVSTATASPSMVGQVELGTEVELGAGDGGPVPGIEPGADGSAGVFDWTIDPSRFSGVLRILVFVEPDAGEPYTTAQEVFEPGERLAGLHCALGEPLRSADVARFLGRAGVTAEWTVVTPTDDPSLLTNTVVEAVPDGVVLSGYPVDASSVRFDVALDADLAALAPLYNPLSDVPCQPGDGDAWR
jgi:hypothetical protein